MRDIFITGGTGTLGQAFITKALAHGKSITCFSRCELKQKQLESKFPDVKFVIGDIRDLDAVERAMRGHRSVFHFAALKHVDVCEKNPEECIKTNVNGTLNLVKAVERFGIENLVFSSTDKAVDPINTYGFSKAIGERIVLNSKAISRVVYRWGNVAASRGSVIPIFVNSLLSKTPHVNLTHIEMTRFWIKIEEAVQFIWATYENPREKVLIPSLKAAPLIKVVESIAEILGVKSYDVRTIGNRGSEKLHERLESQSFDSSYKGYQFTKDELLEFLKPIVEMELKKK